MDTELLHRFTQLIATHTGLQIRAEGADKLGLTLRSRMTQQQLHNPEVYYQLLTIDTAASRHEWEELLRSLTVGETYFFRDSGQFALLRQRILPELINRNQVARTLRIWSAGCSTGEEPYSLAILVHELLPSGADWNVVIVGTDINRDAIAAARRGVYRQHSLRLLDQGIKQRYFHHSRDDWQLDEQIRSMVSFRQVNLFKDSFPDASANLADLDLILCRNVFIYFERTAVTRVIAKFTDALKVGGYLVTGHAELHDQKPSRFCVQSYPESVIYQRQGSSLQAPATKTPQSRVADVPSTALQSVPPSVRVSRTRYGMPQALPLRPLFAASSTATPPSVDDACQAPTASADDLYHQAHRFADVGNYEAARRYCQLALASDSLAERPYYLLAQIAEMQGDIPAAKNFLKKILYISPTAVTAHLELGALYTREQDQPKACKMLNLALEHLRALPAEAVIGPFADLTAAQLIPEVQRRIEQAGFTGYVPG